ncbi:MAG: peptidylprolyl isomerase [Betaproteobacteria bacterium]
MNAFRLLLLSLGLAFGLNAQAANPLVKIRTNLGEMVFELYPDKAPRTVENFLQYVHSGFYNGTIFHRVVQKFVIQGGGFTADFRQKPTLAPIPNEAGNGLKNEPGTLAMARTYDPNSATSQFFVNLDDNLYLNFHRPEPDYYGYCVFGKVVKGMDVVRKIGAQPTGANGPFASDVPMQPVVIEEVAVLSTPISPAKAESTTKGNKVHG